MIYLHIDIDAIELVSNYNRICDNIDFYEGVVIDELLGLS